MTSTNGEDKVKPAGNCTIDLLNATVSHLQNAVDSAFVRMGSAMEERVGIMSSINSLMEGYVTECLKLGCTLAFGTIPSANSNIIEGTTTTKSCPILKLECKNCGNIPIGECFVRVLVSSLQSFQNVDDKSKIDVSMRFEQENDHHAAEAFPKTSLIWQGTINNVCRSNEQTVQIPLQLMTTKILNQEIIAKTAAVGDVQAESSYFKMMKNFHLQILCEFPSPGATGVRLKKKASIAVTVFHQCYLFKREEGLFITQKDSSSFHYSLCAINARKLFRLRPIDGINLNEVYIYYYTNPAVAGKKDSDDAKTQKKKVLLPPSSHDETVVSVIKVKELSNDGNTIEINVWPATDLVKEAMYLFA